MRPLTWASALSLSLLALSSAPSSTVEAKTLGPIEPCIEFFPGYNGNHVGVTTKCGGDGKRRLKLWGVNEHGQLGNEVNPNYFDEKWFPAMFGLRSVKGLDNLSVNGGCLGYRHTCLILAPFANATVGDLKCFGGNSEGQLGLGDKVNRGLAEGSMDSLPYVDVGGKMVKDVKCGDVSTCVLLEDNTVKCFGSNQDGALGIDSDAERVGDEPDEMGENLEAVKLPFEIKAISVGSKFACAVAMNQTSVYCWGSNNGGSLGRGDDVPMGYLAGDMASIAQNPVPLNLPEGYLIESIQSATFTTCVTLRNQAGEKKFKCWGANHHAQLGRGDQVDVGATPESMGSNWTFVDFGDREVTKAVLSSLNHCALFKTGQIGCYGNNAGQFGVQTAPSGASLAVGAAMPVSSFAEPVVDLTTASNMNVLMVGKHRELLHFEAETFVSENPFRMPMPIDVGFCPVTNFLEVADNATLSVTSMQTQTRFYTIKNPLRRTTVVVKIQTPWFLQASEGTFEIEPESSTVIAMGFPSGMNASTPVLRGKITGTYSCKGDPQGVFALPDIDVEITLALTSAGNRLSQGVSWIMGVGAMLAVAWLA